MIKEELEREAEFVTKGWKEQKNCIQAYLAGAKPREKRIAELEEKLEQTEKDLADYQFNYPTIKELEKENAELKLKLEALEGQTPWKDIKDKSELIKENAELKRDKKDLIFIRNQNAKCMCEDKERLTKAKDILTKISQRIPSFQAKSFKDLALLNALSEAEQFLKDCEEEK